MSSPAPSPERGKILWQPSAANVQRSRLAAYQRWLAEKHGLTFPDYESLWRWSVGDVGKFWSTIAEYFEVKFYRAAGEPLVDGERMPGFHWFPGATLNYAEHALRHDDSRLAIVFDGEPPDDGTARHREITRAELRAQVAQLAAYLRELGVTKGDRVAGYLPNIPETIVAFLATASIGAIWTSAPAELTSRGVVEKFLQIQPKILIAVDGYWYGGKPHDRRAAGEEILAGLRSVEAMIIVRGGQRSGVLPGTCTFRARVTRMMWEDALAAHPNATLAFEPVPFEHPLWILYSSGTTGAPKAIVQGHGGILLEHLKALAFHLDLGPDDRFFWFTTAGWMMWNFLVSGLLVDATVVLYDGSPKYPDLRALWRFAAENRVTYFGTSAPYLIACLKEGIHPRQEFDLSPLRALGSTGSPLTPEGFRWVYENVGRDLLLGSVSGGTDVCTAFILSNPTLPVREGEIQCRGLGAAIEAWDESGKPLTNQVGELVLTKPFPSMPVMFWNDEDGSRLRTSYFEHFPGAWRHGDWIKITEDGACVIYGRSDSTLNRGGVRMGTSEFYRAIEEMPEVADALVIDTGALGRDGQLLLFLVLRAGHVLDDSLRAQINTRLRAQLSPRHVPDAIHAIPDVPKTLNGKKLEVPVKRILSGLPIEKAASAAAMANPQSLEFFVAFAKGA
jgi:acetoacetyl-CoA synthetase